MKLTIILVVILGVHFGNEVVSTDGGQLGHQIVKPIKHTLLNRWTKKRGVVGNVSNFNEDLNIHDPRVRFIPYTEENLNEHKGKFMAYSYIFKSRPNLGMLNVWRTTVEQESTVLLQSRRVR
uniref:Uncharacterized protein n=1 Tax=Cacopsylla melanoneura TaxID=428564 RepID=A0A8D8U034_9HEMI